MASEKLNAGLNHKTFTMKKSFIAVLEFGRVKGKITGSLYQIKSNKPVRISDFGYSKQSNKGARSEVVSALVTFGSLPKTALNESGFERKFDGDYYLMIIESREKGIAYIETNKVN